MLTVRYDRFGLQPGERVLDIGCGFGRHAFETARRGGHVVAVDAGLDEVNGVATMFAAMALEGEFQPDDVSATAVQGDTLALPFASNSFDRIICSEMLEHISNDALAVTELTRVLRPGGTLAVTVPRTGPERLNWLLSSEYHNVPGGHVRIYTRRGLESQLRNAGLHIEGHHFAHALHSPYWWLKCLVGTTNDTNIFVRAYHRLLVWDIMKRPRTTRWLEAILNPVLGKSLVLYATKPA